MKNVYLMLSTLIIIFSNSCKNKNAEISEFTINNFTNEIRDTLINKIDPTKIGQVIVNSELILNLFFESYEKDIVKPQINFEQLRISKKINVKKYTNFLYNNTLYNSYLISFFYENDEKYEAILLTNQQLNDGVILFETLIQEGKYLRTSVIDKRIITNKVYRIEYYKYDYNGNIISYLSKPDTTLINQIQFLVYENNFIDFFSKKQANINKMWGDPEIIESYDEKDTVKIYPYQLIGKVNNHVKEGRWEERKYLFEYNRSVWIDGNYVNGLKHGEWNYSPNGPVDKTETYDMGKRKSTIYR